MIYDKLKPLYDRILVKRIEDESKTEGGIIIPESAKEKAQTGKVIAVGAGRRDEDGDLIKLQLKVGDTVFFGKYSGTDAGDEYVILREDDVLATVGK